MMGVTITGERELDSFFKKQPQMISDVKKKWILLTTNDIKNEWQGYITSMGAIKTGRLRNSISVDLNSQDVFTAVEYSVHVELGTASMSARPAMMATVHKIGPKLVQAFVKELKVIYK